MDKQPGGSIILYQTEDGETQIDVHLKDETVWLSLMQMTRLFQRDKSVISRHIRNIYKSGELEECNTVKRIVHSQLENQRIVQREIMFFNLDVIISVGYRVNSYNATRFRMWATAKLRHYILTSFSSTVEILRAIVPADNSTQQIDKAGFVYLLRIADGYSKIGRTKNMQDRLSKLAIQLPYKITETHFIETVNMFEEEKRLHAFFAHKRINGEWFSLDRVDIQTFKDWKTLEKNI